MVPELDRDEMHTSEKEAPKTAIAMKTWSRGGVLERGGSWILFWEVFTFIYEWLNPVAHREKKKF